MKNFFICSLCLLSITFLNSQDIIEIKIDKNQTLWSIARDNGVSLEVIKKLNKISDISKVKAGDIIRLPVKSSSKLSEYIIKNGDTLYSISRKTGVSIDDILKLNNIKNSSEIKVGKVIRLTDNLKSNRLATQTGKGSRPEYKVKAGDTIYSISRKYNISVKEILSINNLKSSDNLRLGQRIKLSNDKTVVSSSKILSGKPLDICLPFSGSIEKFSSAHFNGIAILNDRKQEIKTVKSGVVSLIQEIPGYGLSVFIKHSDGMITTYSSLSATSLKKGDKVEKGAIIGVSGFVRRYNSAGIVFSVFDSKNKIEYDTERNLFVLL